MNSLFTSVLAAADAFLCVLVVIAACDFLRRTRPLDQPLLRAALYLVAIGAFGVFVTTFERAWVNPFSVMLHAGVVLYAWMRRGDVFRAME
ncbi:hypothetical protein PS870_06409 [Pseudomonas fluorescens]|uniref:Uncharacterized protein n=1 Tax=Pseudomonas fluorescens TaxID=294 RepID=A0A5E7QIV0_PSEFL|nr:hypothetical protein [Pseudomonas fluorescens]VVP61669.1 hypothetical protein PS870_06409 [Pseudomonas fluorescens]